MRRTVTEAALKHLWTMNGADEATRMAVVRHHESRLVHRRQVEAGSTASPAASGPGPRDIDSSSYQRPDHHPPFTDTVRGSGHSKASR